jgi:hypothetical protein
MKKRLEASPETGHFSGFNDLGRITVPPTHAKIQRFSAGMSRRSPAQGER